MLITKVNANLAIRFVTISNQIRIIKGANLKQHCEQAIWIENQIRYQDQNGINGLVNLINCLDQNQCQQLLKFKVKTYWNDWFAHRQAKQKSLIKIGHQQWITNNKITTKWFAIANHYLTITYQKQQYGSAYQAIVCWYLPFSVVNQCEQITNTNSYLITYQPEIKVIMKLLKIMMQLSGRDQQLIKDLLEKRQFV